MAWSSVGAVCNAQHKITNATLSANVTRDCPVGSLIVVVAARDNSATAQQDVTNSPNITDSQGNEYLVYGRNTASGAALDGVMAGVTWAVVTTALANGVDQLNLGPGSSVVTAMAFTAHLFDGGAGATITEAGTVQRASDYGADPSSLTMSGMTSREYLFVHGLGAEGPNSDAYTWDADYTQFAAIGTTGGNQVTNIHVRGGYRIFTGTGDTVDVTSTSSDRDYSQTMMAFKADSAPGPPGPNRHASMRSLLRR